MDRMKVWEFGLGSEVIVFDTVLCLHEFETEILMAQGQELEPEEAEYNTVRSCCLASAFFLLVRVAKKVSLLTPVKM